MYTEQRLKYAKEKNVKMGVNNSITHVELILNHFFY